jgi:hypothetical protein
MQSELPKVETAMQWDAAHGLPTIRTYNRKCIFVYFTSSLMMIGSRAGPQYYHITSLEINDKWQLLEYAICSTASVHHHLFYFL